MLIKKTVTKEFEGMGAKIKTARETSDRALTVMCAEAGMTTANWYRIESEEIKALPLETLRKIEKVLNIDFGVEIC